MTPMSLRSTVRAAYRTVVELEDRAIRSDVGANSEKKNMYVIIEREVLGKFACKTG